MARVVEDVVEHALAVRRVADRERVEVAPRRGRVEDDALAPAHLPSEPPEAAGFRVVARRRSFVQGAINQ